MAVGGQQPQGRGHSPAKGDVEFEGRGIATDMIHQAMADARERNLKVVAGCSFVEHFLAENPEYSDLVRTGPAAP